MAKAPSIRGIAAEVEAFKDSQRVIAAPRVPVAWRVKDFADGWILCHTLEQAKREAEGSDNLIQGLYL